MSGKRKTHILRLYLEYSYYIFSKSKISYVNYKKPRLARVSLLFIILSHIFLLKNIILKKNNGNLTILF